MIPKRIQRKRTKGWKMPENTVYVGRPSKWDNPYKVEFINNVYYCILQRKDKRVLPFSSKTREDALNRCIRLYKILIKIKTKAGKLDITELKSKNLACWCSLDKPCHADILLKLINK